MASSFKSFLDNQHLTEEDCDKQITDEYIEVISRTLCDKWRSLPPHIELDPIVIKDIDRCQIEDEEKRSKFFTTWKEKQGSRATFKRLITALLKIECIQDAESVCKLLKKDSSDSLKASDSDSKHQQQSGSKCKLSFTSCTCSDYKAR